MTTLKIDYDGFRHESSLLGYLERHRFVWKFFRLQFKKIEVYKSKRGWHLYLNIENKMDAPTVLFLQALLGSDFKRECFNWERMMEGEKLEDLNVLFEKKYKQERLVSQEKFLLELTAKVREIMMNG